MTDPTVPTLAEIVELIEDMSSGGPWHDKTLRRIDVLFSRLAQLESSLAQVRTLAREARLRAVIEENDLAAFRTLDKALGDILALTPTDD